MTDTARGGEHTGGPVSGHRAVRVRVGEAHLHLEPSGAAVDPARGRLFVADLHLGKGSTLRSAGLPIPSGTSRETMRRVSVAVEHASVAVREVWVLGDLVHTAAGLDAGLVEEVAAWIATLPGGRLHLVRGNHERGAGKLPREWELAEYPDPYRLEAFDAAHVPPDPDHPAPGGRRGVLAGHLHPTVRVGRGTRSRAPKVPAFLGWGGSRGSPRVLVLPAQGRLVDGAVLRGRPGLRAWACADGTVLAVPEGTW